MEADTIAVDEAPVKKRRGRKPKVQPAPESAAGLNAEQFQQLLAVLAQGQQTGGGINMAELREVLAATSMGTAQAMQKAMKPENETHPGVSCFSYPEGDQKRPRPVIPHQFFYNNYPMHTFPETEHWRELELACQITAFGEFTVMRKDFTPMKVTVKGERDGDGKLTRVEVEFPINREDKWKIPPKTVVLYQLAHAGVARPKELFVRGMNEWLATESAADAA